MSWGLRNLVGPLLLRNIMHPIHAVASNLINLPHNNLYVMVKFTLHVCSHVFESTPLAHVATLHVFFMSMACVCEKHCVSFNNSLGIAKHELTFALLFTSSFQSS